MKHLAKTRTRFLCAIASMLMLTGTVFGEQDLPRLEIDPDETVSLEFTDSTIPTVLEVIAAAGDLKFVFDNKFDINAKTSVSLSDISVLDALRFVTRSNDLFYVVSGPKTVLIAPDTRQKRQEHMSQGTRTFPLKFADPKNVITVLRSLLQTRELVHDERLNTIMMKDTSGQLDIAEEVIDRMDREGGKASDVPSADREPLWVGTEFSQDMRSMGDPIPHLEVDMERAVTFDLDDGTVHRAYTVLGEAAGLQFVFDRRIDLSQPASVVIPKMSVQEALDSVNGQFEHFSVVWGPRTVFVTPEIDWKHMTEEHVAIQFFYLSRADRKTVITAIRSQIQSRQIAEIPHLNAVVLKDTVANLVTAQELVERMDSPRSDSAAP